MRRCRSEEVIALDHEIERTLRGLRKQQRERAQAREMAENPAPVANARALRDYALPQVNGVPAVIRKPTSEANNFKIKSVIPQMI